MENSSDGFRIYDSVEFSLVFNEEEYMVYGYVVSEEKEGRVMIRHKNIFTGNEINTEISCIDLLHVPIFAFHAPMKKHSIAYKQHKEFVSELLAEYKINPKPLNDILLP